MSACMAMPSPPPRQKPWMRAITGLAKSPSLRRPALVSRSYSCCASALLRLLANWLMSAPDTKALSPAPVRTTTRTAGSSAQPSRIADSPSHISTDMALRFSGWLKVIRPTPSAAWASILPPACSVTWSIRFSLPRALPGP